MKFESIYLSFSAKFLPDGRSISNKTSDFTVPNASANDNDTPTPATNATIQPKNVGIRRYTQTAKNINDTLDSAIAVSERIENAKPSKNTIVYSTKNTRAYVRTLSACAPNTENSEIINGVIRVFGRTQTISTAVGTYGLP